MRKVSYQSRPQVVQTLRRYLMAGYDVELLSPRGNGGTRFLREVFNEIREHGQAALMLPEVGEERPLPAALISALTGESRSLGNAALTAPGEIAGQMVRAFGNRPLTILVDGTQAVSPVLQGAFAHYRQSSQLHLVVLSEHESTLLERSPQSVNMVLPVLTLEEMGAVLHGVFGTPFEASTLSRIYAKSGGLVKLALAMSEIGMIEGHLKQIEGAWVAVRDLWSGRLAPMVRGYVQSEDPALLESLETLAVAGLTSAQEAISLIGVRQLEELERRRLVAVEPAGQRHWVTVTPPILGEMYRHGHGAMRLGRVSAQVQEVTSRSLSERERTPREIRVGRINPLLLRRLAEHQSMTLRESRSWWRNTATPESGIAYAELLMLSNAPAEETMPVIAAGLASATSGGQRARLRVWEARVHGHALEDVPTALKLLSEETNAGEYRGLLVAAKMWMLLHLGSIPEDAESQLSGWEESPLGVQAEAGLALAAVHLARGRIQSAEDQLAEISQLTEHIPGYRMMVLEAAIAVMRGSFTEARWLITEGFDRATDELDGRALRGFMYVMALLLVVRGQGVGIPRLRELTAALGEVPTFPQIAYLGIRACSVVIADGTREELESLLDDFESLRIPDAVLPGAGRAWARARIAAAEGDLAGAARLCWADAQEMRRRGGLFAAVQGGQRALEYRFDEAQAKIVDEWLRETDSELLHSAQTYLWARVRNNVDDVLGVIPRLAASGQVGHVVQAYRELAQGARARGDSAFLARLEDESEQFTSSLENGGLDLLHMAAPETKLTRREDEVARLLAAGLTNRQIQDELVLSIRTVENHVHRLMRKLGLTTRQEVIELVHSWSSPRDRDRA